MADHSLYPAYWNGGQGLIESSLAFEKNLEISFFSRESDEIRYPSAVTCSMEIRLPRPTTVEELSQWNLMEETVLGTARFTKQ